MCTSCSVKSATKYTLFHWTSLTGVSCFVLYHINNLKSVAGHRMWSTSLWTNSASSSVISCGHAYLCMEMMSHTLVHSKGVSLSIVKSFGWSVNHVILWNSDWKIFVSKLEVSQWCFIFQRDKFNVMHTIKWLSWLASWSIRGKYM